MGIRERRSDERGTTYRKQVASVHQPQSHDHSRQDRSHRYTSNSYHRRVPVHLPGFVLAPEALADDQIHALGPSHLFSIQERGDGNEPVFLQRARKEETKAVRSELGKAHWRILIPSFDFIVGNTTW